MHTPLFPGYDQYLVNNKFEIQLARHSANYKSDEMAILSDAQGSKVKPFPDNQITGGLCGKAKFAAKQIRLVVYPIFFLLANPVVSLVTNAC